MHCRTNQLLTTKQAASKLGLSYQTLEKWRVQKREPRFVKIGGKTVRYRESDLDAFIQEGFSNA